MTHNESPEPLPRHVHPAILGAIPLNALPVLHMGEGLEVFHFEDGKQSFEDFCHENGERYWWQSDLQRCLGYDTLESFLPAVNAAVQTFHALGIPLVEGFRGEKRILDGEVVDDYKLSRSACYLIVMSADARKPIVAQAKAWFMALAEVADQLAEHADAVERVITRAEVTDQDKLLNTTAHAAGVRDFGRFKNNGYRGMYDMDLGKLKAMRGLEGGDVLYDRMGSEELAANLFRLTQTRARMQKEGTEGQWKADAVAFSVGRMVRNTMVTPPEELPVAEDVRKLKSGLKKAHRQLKKIDERKQQRRSGKDRREEE